MKDLSVAPLLASLMFGNGLPADRDPFSIRPKHLKINKRFPFDKQDKPDLQQWKDFESLLPTAYRWRYGETHKRKIELTYAKEKIEVLKDYSVLLDGCGAQGTGWILDYVLPDKNKGETYPKKWFIGTAAHVAEHFTFDVANPYNQLLPKNYGGRCSKESGSDGDYGIVLGKEKPDVSEAAFDRRKFTKNPEVVSQLIDQEEQYDVVSKKDERDAEQVDKWWFWTKPKLVYYPYNYLIKEQKNYSKYNYKLKDYAVDFAVFEVDFGDEKVAKLFTRDFYGKYNRENGSKKEQALDFFAKPIADKYTNKQLIENDVQVFGVGYPRRGIDNNSSSNYNYRKHTAGRFSYYRERYMKASEIKDEKGEELLGHADMWLFLKRGKETDLMWDWAGRKMHMRGYGYVIEENILAPGASGGLFATEYGDVLGTLSFRDKDTRNTFISALRNKEIKDKDGNVLYPAYDLMEGVEDQLISYKSQIQTYVLSQCKQTELSRLRKWENIMDYDKNCPTTNSSVLS